MSPSSRSSPVVPQVARPAPGMAAATSSPGNGVALPLGSSDDATPLVVPSRAGWSVCRTSLILLGADLAGLTWAAAIGSWIAAATGTGAAVSLPLLACLSVNLALTLALFGAYPGIAVSPIVEFRRLVTAVTLTLLSCSLVVCTLAGDTRSWPVLLPTWLLAVAIVPAWRALVRRLCCRCRWWGQSVVVVGSGEAARRTAMSLLQDPRQGLRPRAIVAPSSVQGRPALPSALRDASCVLVVAQPGNDEVFLNLRTDGVARQVFLGLPPVGRGLGELWLEPAQCGDLAALRAKNRLLLPHHQLVKRAFDLAAAASLLAALLPLFLLLAAVVRLSGRGPIFYGHRRLGRHGCTFRAWKFRTMVRDADACLERYLAAHPELRAEWQATQKLRRDPRITWCGRLLRRSSLDELPQLWNVLVGDMSLIGPRPIVANEVARYGEHFATTYQAVRPGITGLWQVSGRNGTTYARRVELDAFYARNWSLWLDAYIALRTVRTVLLGEGAY